MEGQECPGLGQQNGPEQSFLLCFIWSLRPDPVTLLSQVHGLVCGYPGVFHIVLLAEIPLFTFKHPPGSSELLSPQSLCKAWRFYPSSIARSRLTGRSSTWQLSDRASVKQFQVKILAHGGKALHRTQHEVLTCWAVPTNASVPVDLAGLGCPKLVSALRFPSPLWWNGNFRRRNNSHRSNRMGLSMIRRWPQDS